MLQHAKGTLKLTQLLYFCTQCKTSSTTALEYRWHVEGDTHKKSQSETSGENQDNDVADVFRQITALTEAAQAEAPAKKKSSNKKNHSSKRSESVQEVDKNKVNLVSTNINKNKDKAFEAETSGAKNEDKTKCKSSLSSISDDNDTKEITSSHEQSNNNEDSKAIMKSTSENKDNNTSSHQSYRESAVVTQETISSFNDYGYAEHSINFVSNPNYTPSYSYQTCNSYEKVSSEQSNLTNLYNNYQDNAQLQNYYSQTGQYQPVSQSSQSYNCFNRVPNFQHSTLAYCSPSVINQSLPKESSKELSYFAGHPQQKQGPISFSNYETFQSGYTRPGDQLNLQNPSHAQENGMNSSINNFSLKSAIPKTETHYSETCHESERNHDYKEQYDQFGPQNESSTLNYSQETSSVKNENIQEIVNNTCINKATPSSTKV